MARDAWVLSEDALGRAIVHPVIALAMRVMVPARDLEERGDDVGRDVAGCGGSRGRGGGRLNLDPAAVPVLASERVLDVAQSGIAGRARPGARQPDARVTIVCAERLQPALRFLLEIVDGAHETPSFRNRLASA